MFGELPQELDIELAPDVQALLEQAERTEDITISPDRSRMAIAGFYSHQVLVLDVSLAAHGQLAMRSESGVLIRCDGFDLPHGVTFLDDDTLCVASRASGLTFFDLSELRGTSGIVKPKPLLDVPGGDGLEVSTPGSLDSRPLGDGRFELVVCNNYSHRVSRHVVDMADGCKLVSSEVILADQFDVPDGVIYSPDRKLIAVSNHHEYAVQFYELGAITGPDTPPVAVLHETGFPHGLAFACGGECFFVADAGLPYVHMFKADGGNWRGGFAPCGHMQVLNTQQFMLGRADPAEGGPKGLCAYDDLDLLMMTCEFKQLMAFRLSEVIDYCASDHARNGFARAKAMYEAMPIMSVKQI